MKERLLTWIAWHLPKSLVYWATIRAGAHASTGKYSDQIVPEMTYLDVLRRWPT